MAADPNDEAQWRAEFEHWLGAEAQKRLHREERSVLYLKLTLAAAILGVIVGIVGIVVTAMHVD